MPPTPTRTAALALALLLGPAAGAQERPREEDLFGAPPPAGEKAPAPEPARPGEADLLRPAPAGQAPPDAASRLAARLGQTEDALKLGGLLYWRSNLYATEEGPPSQWKLDAPALLDLYLDARPNDRVRGFALARTFYDPTIAAGYRSFQYTLTGSIAFPDEPPPNPRAVLDQLWIRFDAGRTAFLTVGRQHVKWGVGRFWNPGDFLHPVRRDPLATFDERAGLTMVRVHLPWEARGWNLYAVAVLERLVNLPDPSPPTPNALGAVGGGGRAEVVLGTAELGLSGVAQRGMEPRLSFDVTTGLWELDLRAEVVWRGSPDLPRLVPGPPGWVPDPSQYPRLLPGPRVDAVGGVEWSWRYSDEDTLTVGAEYFFHEAGYENPRIYPVLILEGLYTPFYVGRHYGGLYLVLPRPGSWNLHTVTLSAIANFTDGSAIARLDWSYTLLTHLTLEAYAAGHLGKKGGEFRLGLEVPGVVSVPAPVVDLGIGLRLPF
jgi:hypothetical protein